MFCFRYKRLLIPYNEGVLGEAERAGVEAHLSRCAGCRSELEAVRSVSGALRAANVPAMEPATDLWAKVSARIETEAARPTTRPWLRVPQAASACAAAVLLAVVGIGMFGPNAPAPPPQCPPAVERWSEKPAARAEAPPVEKPSEEIARLPERRVSVGTGDTASRETPRRAAAPAPPAAIERVSVVRGIEAKPAPTPATVALGREAKPATRAYDAKARYARRGDTSLNWHFHGTEKGVSVAPGRAAGRPTGTVNGVSEEKLADTNVDYAWDDKDGDSGARNSHFYADGAMATRNRPAASLGLARADKPSESAGTAVAGKPSALASSAAAPAAAPAPSAGVAFGSHMALTCGDTPTLSADMDTKGTESVVDTLNETEGVHVAALFAYP